MALDLLFSWISTCFHIIFKTVFKALDRDLHFVQCCIIFIIILWGNTPTFCVHVIVSNLLWFILVNYILYYLDNALQWPTCNDVLILQSPLFNRDPCLTILASFEQRRFVKSQLQYIPILFICLLKFFHINAVTVLVLEQISQSQSPSVINAVTTKTFER